MFVDLVPVESAKEMFEAVTARERRTGRHHKGPAAVADITGLNSSIRKRRRKRTGIWRSSWSALTIS